MGLWKNWSVYFRLLDPVDTAVVSWAFAISPNAMPDLLWNILNLLIRHDGLLMCSSLPTSKTMAAITSQAPVLVHNLQQVRPMYRRRFIFLKYFETNGAKTHLHSLGGK